MLFALLCIDKPDSLDVRLNTRAEHLVFLQSLGDDLMFAGPFLDDALKPNGSLVVIRARDKAAAQEIAARDPYARAGLFASVDIKAWNWALNAPEGV